MKLFVSLVCVLAFFNVHAQKQSDLYKKPTELDSSPMDMSYWPIYYPVLKMEGKTKAMPIARVLFGRPLKNGRAIFGTTLRYDQVWRLGANEATEIEFF